MICKGRRANIWISEPMEHYGEIPYYFATPQVWKRITGEGMDLGLGISDLGKFLVLNF